MGALNHVLDQLPQWQQFPGSPVVDRQSRLLPLPRDLANDFRKNDSDPLQNISPSDAFEHGGGQAEMPSGPIARKDSDSYGNGYEARTKLQRSFELHVTDPAKIVARKIGASPDTVESHRQSVPKSWASLVAYCRAYPALALDLMDAVGLEIDRDRESYAIFLSLQRQMRGE